MNDICALVRGCLNRCESVGRLEVQNDGRRSAQHDSMCPMLSSKEYVLDQCEPSPPHPCAQIEPLECLWMARWVNDGTPMRPEPRVSPTAQTHHRLSLCTSRSLQLPRASKVFQRTSCARPMIFQPSESSSVAKCTSKTGNP